MSKFQRVLKLVLLMAIGMCISFIIHTVTVSLYPTTQVAETKLSLEYKYASYSRAFQWNTSKPKTMLVILTYMRSGSSFTGKIIQKSPDVFYVFEPLWSMEQMQKRGLKPIYFNRDAMPHNRPRGETLENFLTCNLTDVDLTTLRQNHMMNSATTLPYFKCIYTKQGILGTLDCLSLLEKPCRESRVSGVKTIRYNMKEMSYLMKKHSGMKILHLIRDPRPTLLSQRRVGEFIWKDLNTSATDFCNRVDEDLKYSVELKSKYPARIFTLRYEDLAKDPNTTAKRLYNFLNIEYTSNISQYIASITTVDKPNCGAMCTTKNSSAVLSNWRHDLPIGYVSTIDNACKNLYPKVGYLPVKDNASLKNLTIPVHVDPPKDITSMGS